MSRPSKKKKQVNNRGTRFSFTLNNWGDEELYHLYLAFVKFDVKYCMEQEVGAGGTPHIQGYFELPKRWSFKQVKDRINGRMHFERSGGSRQENMDYCTKEGDFMTNMPVKVSRRRRQLAPYLKPEHKWRDWQQMVIDKVEKGGNKRKILWIWEKVGNVGKSYLSKYLGLKYDAILATGKGGDVAHQVIQWFEGKGEDDDPKLVVCDIPRHSLEYVNYATLESLVNGMVVSGKYEGGKAFFDSPVVVVFANEPPKKEKMSADRWDIIQLVNLGMPDLSVVLGEDQEFDISE